MRVSLNTFRISALNFKKEQKISTKDVIGSDACVYPKKFDNEILGAKFLYNKINFNGRIAPKKFKLIKYANEISCPSCGEKMHDFDKTKAEMLACRIAILKGEELSNTLIYNMQEFHPSKRGLVEVIAKEATENPDLEFCEILTKISPDYTERLRMKQIAVVIDLTSDLIRRFPSKEAEIEKWRYGQIKQVINAEDEGDFRNKVLIDLLLEFSKQNGIEISKHEIEPFLSRLPNSKKDKDAFVVKYKRRSSEEGIFHLIKDTHPTIEHISTYSKSRNNEAGNLMLMCFDCNNARSSVPYRNFVKTHPEMVENVEKYLSDVKKILHR